MSFDMNRLRRFNPDEELTQQEIKDLKDGVPNYVPNNGLYEVQGPNPPHEYLCGECTGSGIMLGFYPCKPCGGKGYIIPESGTIPASDANRVELKEIGWNLDDIWPKEPIIGEVREMTMDEIKELAILEDSIQFNWDKFNKMIANAIYPNERELSLLNNRIATLKAQLSKELQLKKSERNQFEIKTIQQSINTLTKWKLQNKNSTQTGY